MKNTLLVFLFVLLTSPAHAASPRYRVIKVQTTLNTGAQPEDSTSANDYYVTIGRQHNLKTGALLNVYRDKQIDDETGGETITSQVFVGQIKAIQVHEKFCISRVVGMAGSADPLRERDAVLVGDYVLPVFVIQGEQLFGKGSSTLLPGALKHLEEAAIFIRSNNPSRAVVEGHTDNDGTPAYNLKLSELRAVAVRDYLVNQAKIDPRILHPVGCGESRPIAPNNTPQGQAMNRRFEIIIER